MLFRSLEFIFTPVSNQEAQSVDRIINSFTYYSLPDLVQGSGGQFLTPPQIFQIKFAFTGQPGVLGSIGNVITNTLTNVVGSQLYNSVFGPGSLDASAPNAKIFQVGDCVLKNVNVDYAPNGWAAYDDGYPIQTRLTLQFQEMDIVTKQSMRNWKQFDDTNLSTAQMFNTTPGSEQTNMLAQQNAGLF